MQFATQEMNYCPPESCVRVVKASFGMRKIGLSHNPKVEIASLLTDSMYQPTPAGIRGSFATARQLLYKAGDVCIDLHIRPKPGSEAVVLVGQLLDSVKPPKALSNIPIALVHGGNPVERTKTNDFGEFDFGFEKPEDIHLAVGLENRTLVVPIPN